MVVAGKLYWVCCRMQLEGFLVSFGHSHFAQIVLGDEMQYMDAGLTQWIWLCTRDQTSSHSGMHVAVGITEKWRRQHMMDVDLELHGEKP